MSRPHAFIIQATFAGKASVGAMPSTIRVVATGDDNFGEEEAKRAINSLWYMDGHDINDDEWEDITVTLVDVPYLGYEKLMELLTLHEVEYLHSYYIAAHKEARASEEWCGDTMLWDCAEALHHARFAMYKELNRNKGYQFKMQ